MKAFIKKNKFFVSLLLITLVVISSLSVYTLQKDNKNNDNTEPPVQDEKPTVDSDKQAEITSMSVGYTRSNIGISGNAINVTWAYRENASKVEKVYLYLNNGSPINVTLNSYFEFTQGGYDFLTGNNKIKLELRLEDGETVEMEKTVHVLTIISAKQEVAAEGSTMKITLEYMYSTTNPAEIPEILITNSDSEISPVVAYVNTENKTSGNKVTARATYSFAWNDTASMAKKMNLRWKFNTIQDSFDFTAINPL